MKWIKILLLNWTIRHIKSGWGTCEDLDPDWHKEEGCWSCKATKVIQFLKTDIEYTKDEDMCHWS